MSDSYKVHKAWIKEADFEILILEIPEAEIEDKLAYFARDKGNVTKSFFEDFIIATCVANINQLLFHIKQSGDKQSPNLIKMREEVMLEIIKINPSLDPKNLVVNRNSVIKLKDGEELKDGERPLTSNKSWDAPSYYDDLEKLEKVNNTIPSNEDEKIIKKPATNDLKNINDLEYVVVKQWWSRINKYIQIKKYNSEDVASILARKFFHNRSSFQTYIVSVCVVGSEDLFIMLDEMGLPSRVAPPILMHEVYELCKEVNPQLTYKNAQDLIDQDDEKNKDDDNYKNNESKMCSHARQNQCKKDKIKKTFKDVSKEDLLKLSDMIKVFVIGQDDAVDQIVEAVQRASVGLKDPVKPIGSFLFAGRTGCGKSLTGKVLANELIKDKNNLVTIDCTEYAANHEYAKLIGSPSGYVGHEQGGVLTNAVLENPFSVIIFDEIEKANHRVHELLLQILEEGRLTDGKGQKVSFKDTIVIMTSNIGVTEVEEVKKTIGFGDVAKLTEDKKTKAINQAIKKKFKPELLNRIDSVVYFRSLDKKDYMRIIDIELYKLNENLRLNDTEYKNLKLEFDKKIKAYIYKFGIDGDFGARPLKRFIEKEVSTPLATRLLREDISNEATIQVTVRHGKIEFNISNEEPESCEDVILLTSEADSSDN